MDKKYDELLEIFQKEKGEFEIFINANEEKLKSLKLSKSNFEKEIEKLQIEIQQIDISSKDISQKNKTSYLELIEEEKYLKEELENIEHNNMQLKSNIVKREIEILDDSDSIICIDDEEESDALNEEIDEFSNILANLHKENEILKYGLLGKEERLEIIKSAVENNVTELEEYKNAITKLKLEIESIEKNSCLLENNTPNTDCNSLFSEVQDRRLILEKEIKNLDLQYAEMQQKQKEVLSKIPLLETEKKHLVFNIRQILNENKILWEKKIQLKDVCNKYIDNFLGDLESKCKAFTSNTIENDINEDSETIKEIVDFVNYNNIQIKRMFYFYKKRLATLGECHP